MPDEKPRCGWAKNDLMIRYHDTEWGIPVHDDRKLFEFLILEGAQAGLSWDTVLRKRENYRLAFDDFDAEKIARYDEKKCAEFLQNGGIIRNRLKIASTVQNAKSYLKIKEEFGSFDAYIWRFIEGKTVINNWKDLREVPARTLISDWISRDLKRRDFNFVGSTILYAFMQACGLVYD
ncbi:MAG: DNA-3-methyladenine glycosylase I, partial [Acidobacteriota bacterium]|nr:DNA-3-methyladenine glycosylase I [Acidobacteriota bacterium]